MTRQDLGAPPSGPNDVTTVSWVFNTFPSYSSTVTASENLTLSLPPHPIDHTMYLVEVYPTATLTVTIPHGVALTAGVAPTTLLYSGKLGFFGFRYSATAGTWVLLSATTQL